MSDKKNNNGDVQSEPPVNEPSTEHRILFVSDASKENGAAEAEIRKVLSNLIFYQVWTEEDFLEAFDSFAPDLIIANYKIDRFEGMTTLALAQQHLPDVPFIMLSHAPQAEVCDESVAFINAGAWDYVHADCLWRLRSAVLNAFVRQQERIMHQRVMVALKESEERLRTIVENTSSLIGVLDKNAVYQYASPSHRSMGYSPQELIGKSGFDFIHPEEMDRFLELWAKGMAGELDTLTGLRTQWFNKNGARHYMQNTINVTRDSTGEIENIIYISEDITAAIQAEETLKREKEKFRALVEESPLGVCLLDENGDFTYINPKFKAMFGYTLEEVSSGREWLRQAYPDRDYRHQVMAVWREDLKNMKVGEVPSRRYRVTCKDGSERIVLFFVVVMETGELLAICQDMTDQDALEMRFLHSQKMESIGRLASGVAHDFNNLLTSILGNADFALMDFNPDDPRYEVIDEIRVAAEKAAELTRQLLTFSRRQKSQPEIINLNMKIRETEKMLRRLIGEDVALEILLASDLGPLKIDPGHLEQIIMNLAVNARDAMPAGGRFTIETAAVDMAAETANLGLADLAPGPYVMISVSDTGTGMSREVRRKIFDPFFTTKEQEKGTGLGLSTVYGIVRQNGGDIHVYSQPGQGSTFKIYFPVAQETLLKNQDKVEDDRELLHGSGTILVIEDEEKVRSVVGTMLKKYGYQVLTAGNGDEARRVWMSLERPVDLVLTDMIMPGMTGLEVARQLKEKQPDLKVICMSGYTDRFVYEDFQREDFVFLHKPFSPEALAREVKDLLDK